MKTFKDKLKYCREKSNMNKSDLAKKIGVSPAYITMLENGEKNNPSLEIKIKLSEALNVDIAELFATEYNSEDELMISYLNDAYNILKLNLDESFTNSKELIEIFIETNMFEKDFNVKINNLSLEEKKELENDIYKSIEWLCYRLSSKDK